MGSRYAGGLCPPMILPVDKEGSSLMLTKKHTEVFQAWRSCVYECVYRLMLQYMHDLTSRRDHSIRPILNPSTKKEEIPGELRQDGKPSYLYSYGVCGFLYSFFVSACLLAPDELFCFGRDDGTEKQLFLDNMWWGGDAVRKELRYRVAMFLLSWKLQGLHNSTVCGRSWFDWLDDVVRNESRYMHRTSTGGKIDASAEPVLDTVYPVEWKLTGLFGSGISAYRTVRCMREKMMQFLIEWRGTITVQELREAVAPVVLGHLSTGAHKGSFFPEEEHHHSESENNSDVGVTTLWGDKDDEEVSVSPALDARLKEYSGLALPRQRRRDQALVTVFFKASELSIKSLTAKFVSRGNRDSAGYGQKFREFVQLLQHKSSSGDDLVYFHRLRRFFELWKDCEPVAISMLEKMHGECRPYDLLQSWSSEDTLALQEQCCTGEYYREFVDVRSTVYGRQRKQRHENKCSERVPRSSIGENGAHLQAEEGGGTEEPCPQAVPLLAEDESTSQDMPGGKSTPRPPAVWFYLTDVMGLENVYEILWSAWRQVFKKNEKDTTEALRLIASKLEVEIPPLD
ncbi:unnamed protein product [Amoebophrya sp. A120]|nr:unnamed protein product [Amoebophrya sp. A120]|eukprot:GSA120T00005039001.1